MPVTRPGGSSMAPWTMQVKDIILAASMHVIYGSPLAT
jgi:hypothetical protein